MLWKHNIDLSPWSHQENLKEMNDDDTVRVYLILSRYHLKSTPVLIQWSYVSHVGSIFPVQVPCFLLHAWRKQGSNTLIDKAKFPKATSETKSKHHPCPKVPDQSWLWQIAAKYFRGELTLLNEVGFRKKRRNMTRVGGRKSMRPGFVSGSNTDSLFTLE